MWFIMKDYIVRKFDWTNVNDEEIPYDFLDIMEYFNESIEKDLYPFIPRHNPMTKKEFFDKWLPNKDKDICYVALSKSLNKVVASVTIFINKEK